MDSEIIIISSIILLAVIRPFTTLIHELGHGLSALLLTKDKVRLFIGYQEDQRKGLRLHLGRLEIFFRYNPFLLNPGLCIPRSLEISRLKNIIIILSGPAISLLVGMSSIYIILGEDLHGSLKFIGLLLLISSLADFFINIIPNRQPMILSDGLIIFNDGQQIVHLIKNQVLPNHINAGVYYYHRKEFGEACRSFRKLLEDGIRNVHIYRLAISSMLFSQDYQEALLLLQTYQGDFILDSNDFGTSAHIKSYFGRYEEALLDFEKSFEIDINNKYSILNRGYTYLLMGSYEKAIIDFTRVIELKFELAYSYSNRGLAKIKMGMESDGLSDLNRSLKIDASNSYVHRNFGIYYFDNSDFGAALIHFKRAFKLGPNTHLLRDYLLRTENEINKSGSPIDGDDNDESPSESDYETIDQENHEKLELEVVSVSRAVSSKNNYTVALGKSDSDLQIRIVVGPFEAQAMVVELERIQTNLPLTHRLSYQCFNEMGYEISEALIYDLVDDVFVGRLTFDNKHTQIQMECRVSDMIVLAMISKIPIYCEKFVFDAYFVNSQLGGLSTGSGLDLWNKLRGFLR